MQLVLTWESMNIFRQLTKSVVLKSTLLVNKYMMTILQIIVQQPDVLFSGSSIAAFIPFAKASFIPLLFKAEHSTEKRAPIFARIASASDGLTKSSPWASSSSCFALSCRRSDFKPTRTMGAFGQCTFSSGTHFVETFSNEDVEQTE